MVVCLLMSLIAALFASVTRSVRLANRLRRAEKIADGGFLLALSGLFTKVTMADGAVTADEFESVKGIFRSMGLTPAGRAMCIGNFVLAQQEPCDARTKAEELASALDHVSCVFLYSLLWRVANADGRVSEGEERLLAEVGAALRLNDEEIRQVREDRLRPIDRKALSNAGVPESLIRYIASCGASVPEGDVGCVLTQRSRGTELQVEG